MNCPNCGAPLNDQAAFCTNCGTPIAQQPQNTQYAQPAQPAQPVQEPQQQYNQYQQPQYQQPQYQQPANAQFFEDATAQQLSSSIYGFGIAGFVCSFVFSLLGLIFSIIAMNKAKQYEAYTGGLYNKAATGKKFAVAGLVLSIVFIAIGLLSVICSGCLACAGAAGSYYY